MLSQIPVAFSKGSLLLLGNLVPWMRLRQVAESAVWVALRHESLRVMVRTFLQARQHVLFDLRGRPSMRMSRLSVHHTLHECLTLWLLMRRLVIVRSARHLLVNCQVLLL